MDTITGVFVICLCLAAFILGMITMALLLHPYRSELKRSRQREAAHQRYQRQLRDLDRR